MKRSFRQTLPHVIGAMRLLASSIPEPQKLNREAFGLYAEFRPDVMGWGKKAEMRLEKILDLRKPHQASTSIPPAMEATANEKSGEQVAQDSEAVSLDDEFTEDGGSLSHKRQKRT